MKSISATISFLLFILLLRLAAAASPALDQRNRPPVIARIQPRSNSKKQHHISYDSRPSHISCNIDNESPLSADVSAAVAALYGGHGHPLRCNFDNTPGDGGNQFCTTLAARGSAAIAVCTSWIGRIDCEKVAGIAMAVSAKCEEECAGELRIAGMVGMDWGNIFVVNSAVKLRVE